MKKLSFVGKKKAGLVSMREFVFWNETLFIGMCWLLQTAENLGISGWNTLFWLHQYTSIGETKRHFILENNATDWNNHSNQIHLPDISFPGDSCSEIVWYNSYIMCKLIFAQVWYYLDASAAWKQSGIFLLYDSNCNKLSGMWWREIFTFLFLLSPSLLGNHSCVYGQM